MQAGVLSARAWLAPELAAGLGQALQAWRRAAPVPAAAQGRARLATARVGGKHLTTRCNTAQHPCQSNALLTAVRCMHRVRVCMHLCQAWTKGVCLRAGRDAFAGMVGPADEPRDRAARRRPQPARARRRARAQRRRAAAAARAGPAAQRPAATAGVSARRGMCLQAGTTCFAPHCTCCCRMCCCGVRFQQHHGF